MTTSLSPMNKYTGKEIFRVPHYYFFFKVNCFFYLAAYAYVICFIYEEESGKVTWSTSLLKWLEWVNNRYLSWHPMLTGINAGDLKCLSAENINVQVSSTTVASCNTLSNVLKSQHHFPQRGRRDWLNVLEGCFVMSSGNWFGVVEVQK